MRTIDTSGNINTTWVNHTSITAPDWPIIRTVNASGGADYTRIQDAINDANNGDTILVSSGNYTELQVNVNKQLILKGINTGGGKPVVEGSDSANGGAIILTAGGITLEGFNTDFRTLFNRHNSL